MQEKMIAFCGMTCSECRTFIATWRNDGELREEVAKSWSTETETLKPEDMNCAGCLATEGRLFKFCATCEVRRRGYEKGVENCAYCREFPCVKLTSLWESEGATKAKATLEGIRNKLRA